jgi:hypothetical protein
MFAELMPLLKQRVLILTISRVDDELILVNVIPKKLDKDRCGHCGASNGSVLGKGCKSTSSMASYQNLSGEDSQPQIPRIARGCAIG